MMVNVPQAPETGAKTPLEARFETVCTDLRSAISEAKARGDPIHFVLAKSEAGIVSAEGILKTVKEYTQKVATFGEHRARMLAQNETAEVARTDREIEIVNIRIKAGETEVTNFISGTELLLAKVNQSIANRRRQGL